MNHFLNRTEIITVQNGFNPWWSARPFVVPEFRRLAFEACTSYLANTGLRRAVLLSGPRRVGKTTVLQQMAQALVQQGDEPRSILYMSLDHPLLRLLPLRDIITLYHESAYPEGKPATLLLDEIQYAPEWEREIKLLVDHQPQYRIVATGSASVVHKERLAESGVGRWITVPIPTLSFFEFVQICHEEPHGIAADLRVSDLFNYSPSDLSALANQIRPLLPLFQRYLLFGGFPETATQGNTDLCQRLLREDVVERVLKRDMTALFRVRKTDELEKLFVYLCLHSGGILAHQTCAKALGTTTTTVANHLTLMEQANLIYRLPPSALGGKQVLKARNKYYLIDAALRNAILLRGEEILTQPEEMGTIVETTVLRHLYAYYYRDTPEIVYWRDAATHKEVDIIVRSPAYVIPFVVKYKEKPGLDKKRGLGTYCISEKPKYAYLVTKRDVDFAVTRLGGVDTTFLKVPAHMLCYLLGQSERLLWK
ncbi:MAG: ATP-binding protein [Thermodesulfobacteriota bacterium]|nr:ATP-binding protein [Thermodesulfobacteriota bacterium]